MPLAAAFKLLKLEFVGFEGGDSPSAVTVLGLDTFQALNRWAADPLFFLSLSKVSEIYSVEARSLPG